MGGQEAAARGRSRAVRFTRRLGGRDHRDEPGMVRRACGAESRRDRRRHWRLDGDCVRIRHLPTLADSRIEEVWTVDVEGLRSEILARTFSSSVAFIFLGIFSIDQVHHPSCYELVRETHHHQTVDRGKREPLKYNRRFRYIWELSKLCTVCVAYGKRM